MANIKNKNTRPEIAIRSLLYSQGFCFCIHDNYLPGKPDLVLRKYQAVIFIHGCFWHRHEDCKLASTPKQISESGRESLRIIYAEMEWLITN